MPLEAPSLAGGEDVTGVLATDVTDARRTLSLNVTRRQWSKTIFDLHEIPFTTAPPIFEPHQITGKINKEVASKVGLAPGITVCAGGAGHIIVALGNNSIETQQAVYIVGTGVPIMTPLDYLQIDPNMGLYTFPYFFPNKWILMGAILCGGICLNWFLRLISEGKFYSEGDQYEFLTEDLL